MCKLIKYILTIAVLLAQMNSSLFAYFPGKTNTLAVRSIFAKRVPTDEDYQLTMKSLVAVATLSFINKKLTRATNWIELASHAEDNIEEMKKYGLEEIHIKRFLYLFDYPKIRIQNDTVRIPLTDAVHVYYIHPKSQAFHVDEEKEAFVDEDTVGNHVFTLVARKKDKALPQNPLQGKRVLVLSTRLNHYALDGVSLEANKWAYTYKQMGAKVYYFSGETKVPEFVDGHKTYNLSYFRHPRIAKINEKLFTDKPVTDELRLSDEEFHKTWEEILEIKNEIKWTLRRYLLRQNIEYINAENGFFPTNLQLTLALVEVANELGLKTISHSHDFIWERSRFNARHEGITETVNEALTAIKNLSTVVINSRQFNRLSAQIDNNLFQCPNVMDFDNPPQKDEERVKEFRKHFSVWEKELLFLAPVRPVHRKRLDRTIDILAELQKRVKKPVTLMITHQAGDEGMDYLGDTLEYAQEKGVSIIYAASDIGVDKQFTLEEAYHASDMVIYTPEWEGWGNALVEAMYYKKPIVMTPYPIYNEDIKPKGVQTLEVNFENGEITNMNIIDRIIDLTKPENAEEVERMVEENFAIGQKFFSFGILSDLLLLATKRLDIQKPIEAYKALKNMSQKGKDAIKAIPEGQKTKKLLIRFDVDNLPQDSKSLYANLVSLVHAIKTIKRRGRDFGLIDFELISGSGDIEFLERVTSHNVIKEGGISLYKQKRGEAAPERNVSIINPNNLRILGQGDRFIPLQEIEAGFLAPLIDTFTAAVLLGRLTIEDITLQNHAYEKLVSLYLALSNQTSFYRQI